MISIIHAIERLNIWIGRSFGWCILILTLSVAYEVFVRYVINAPTVWAFDMMVQMYGALFLMAGPYALAQDTHVRADVVYRFLQPRWQALVDIILYILFFFPGMLALFWFGWEIASDSWRNQNAKRTARADNASGKAFVIIRFYHCGESQQTHQGNNGTNDTACC